jgi:uncharacterized protein (TIGR02594 family)
MGLLAGMKPVRPLIVASPLKPVVPPWMVIAQSYIGIHEGDGLHSNPKVIKFFIEAGHAEVKNDHTTPWCAAFVGAVLAEAHLPTTGTLWALDYAKYGQRIPTNHPVVGAIGTKHRAGGGGHVFFVAGFDKSWIYALGGNQGDKVCIEKIARAELFSLCYPPGVLINGAGSGPAIMNIAAANLSEK